MQRSIARDLSSSGLDGAVVVEDLTALKALSSRPGIVASKGGATAFDGLGVQWAWDAGSATTADDKTVVTPTAGAAGRYKKLRGGKWWLESGFTPSYDEAATVLSRALAIDTYGVTLTIPASKQLDLIGLRNGGNDLNFTIGSGASVAGHAFYMRSLLGSDAASNLYGVIGSVTNAGPGVVKAVYGRAVAVSGSTGVLMGAAFGINTIAGLSHATGIQITPDTDGGGVVDELIWATANGAAGTVLANYGLLLQDVAIQLGGAGFQMQAKGAGDFIRLNNSAGNATLFSVDSTGKVDFQSTQSTVGAAGAATALPAQPTGYIPIKIAGVARVIPYYAAS